MSKISKKHIKRIIEELPMDDPIEDFRIVYDMGYDAHRKRTLKLLGKYQNAVNKKMKGWCKYALYQTTNHLTSIITTAKGNRKKCLLKRYDKQEELSKKFLIEFRKKFLKELEKLRGEIDE